MGSGVSTRTVYPEPVRSPVCCSVGRPEAVLSKYSADGHFDSMSASRFKLRSSSMIKANQSAEALGAFDGERWRFLAFGRFDQPIIDPLVVPLAMIVSGVLASGLP